MYRCLAYLRRLERVSKEALRHLSKDGRSSSEGEGSSQLFDESMPSSHPSSQEKLKEKRPGKKTKEWRGRRIRRENSERTSFSGRGHLGLQTSLLLDSESEEETVEEVRRRNALFVSN